MTINSDFQFIHAADIHLDSPLLNLERYDGAPIESLRVATRTAFDHLIQLAIDQQVQFLLISGDLYNNETHDYNSPIHVRQQFLRLESAGVGVYIIQGNHDASADAKRAFSLKMPGNVRVFSTSHPETLLLDELGVAIHGQGFSTRHISEDLSARFPDPIPGYFNIGLLHTNLGSQPDHDPYAPSTIEGLTMKGYQYWALGHIHKRSTDLGPDPCIFYPGNTQGRHIGETGPKGCLLVNVVNRRYQDFTFEPLDVWRWHICSVDASDCETIDAFMDRALRSIEILLAQSDGRAIACRVQIHGQSALHHELVGIFSDWREQLRFAVRNEFDDRVWIEKCEVRTTDLRGTFASPVSGSNYAELLDGFESVTLNSDRSHLLMRDLEKAATSLPKDKRLSTLAAVHDATTASIPIDEAKSLILSLLQHPEDRHEVR